MLDRTRATEDRARPTAADERSLDEVLAESFPASDPPPWTPGIVRPEPTAVPDPRRDRQRTSQQGFAAPLFVLVVALPMVLAVRGILEVIGCLFSGELLPRR